MIELLQYTPEVITAGFPFAAVAIGAGLLGLSSAAKGRRMAARQSADALGYRRERDAELDKQRDVYRSMEFNNPYADLENKFEGMTNQFAGMENTMEDLEVNTQQADFMQRQSQQNTANILSGLRGAAGGSGVAGLAQALANQANNQSTAASASIGQQEAANSKLKAQEASRIQGMVRGEQARIQQMIMGEDARLQMADAGGEANVEQAERDRQSTLLGMAQGRAAGANAALQQGYANQMAAQSSMTQGLFGIAGASIGGIQ